MAPVSFLVVACGSSGSSSGSRLQYRLCSCSWLQSPVYVAPVVYSIGFVVRGSRICRSRGSIGCRLWLHGSDIISCCSRPVFPVVHGSSLQYLLSRLVAPVSVASGSPVVVVFLLLVLWLQQYLLSFVAPVSCICHSLLLVAPVSVVQLAFMAPASLQSYLLSFVHFSTS